MADEVFNLQGPTALRDTLLVGRAHAHVRVFSNVLPRVVGCNNDPSLVDIDVLHLLCCELLALIRLQELLFHSSEEVLEPAFESNRCQH